MSIMICDACSTGIDTDFMEAFEVREAQGLAVKHYCQGCLLKRAAALSDGANDPFLINGEPADVWAGREIGW